MRSGSPSAETGKSIGQTWNEFWFTPTDPLPLSILRIVVGWAALYYLFSFTRDLEFLFSSEGILPRETMIGGQGPDGPVAGLLDEGRIQPGAIANRPTFHLSYFYYFTSPDALWVAHGLGAVVILAFILGWQFRWIGPLTLLVVWSYYHRAPMLAGQFDLVLIVSMLYVALCPVSGMHFSAESIFQPNKYVSRKERERRQNLPDDQGEFSLTANLGLRLLQIHLSALYLAIAMSHWGNEVWTSGEAMWRLMARVDSRLFDGTEFHRYQYVVNVWTLGVAAFELTFGLFIWNRRARPWLLAASLVVWPSLAIVSGLTAYCFLMMALGIAFVSPETLRYRLGMARLPAVLPQGKKGP